MKQRAVFLERIQQNLIKKRDEMTNELSRMAADKVSDGQVQDTGDEALAVSMEKLQNSLQRAEADELRLMDDAIERIQRGEYGVCIDCGEHIAERRLETFPYAARCVACQEAFEQ